MKFPTFSLHCIEAGMGGLGVWPPGGSWRVAPGAEADSRRPDEACRGARLGGPTWKAPGPGTTRRDAAVRARCGVAARRRCPRIVFLPAPCIASRPAGVAPEIPRGPDPQGQSRGAAYDEAPRGGLRPAERWAGRGNPFPSQLSQLSLLPGGTSSMNWRRMGSPPRFPARIMPSLSTPMSLAG